MEIYLDNSATTKPYSEVIEKVVYALSHDYANPSSLHRKGVEVEKNIKSIRKGITSDDETRVLEFIKNEIHPLFEEIKNRNPEIRAEIITYYKKLDPNFGFLYQDRKKYEESVAKINDMISWVLNDAEKEGQKMIPHY